jgi:hypothetical protein
MLNMVAWQGAWGIILLKLAEGKIREEKLVEND